MRNSGRVSRLLRRGGGSWIIVKKSYKGSGRLPNLVIVGSVLLFYFDLQDCVMTKNKAFGDGLGIKVKLPLPTPPCLAMCP